MVRRKYKFLSAALVGVVASSFLTQPAEAAPPECDVGIYQFKALLCANAGEHLNGVFATWKDVPIEYEQGLSAGVYTRMNLSINSDDNTYVLIGLEAVQQEGDEVAYGPFWEEVDPDRHESQAIIPAREPAEPDGSSHTYMLLKAGNTAQWDIVYDFNPVATTELQKDTSPRVVESSLLVFDPGNTTVPRIRNRLQFLTGNNYWKRFSRDNVAVSTAVSCGASTPPPICFEASRQHRSGELVEWRVAKPSAGTAGTAGTAPILPSSGAALSSVFNGVDQEELRICMGEDAEKCLEEVEGLEECVELRKVCNLNSYASAEGKPAQPYQAVSVNADQAVAMASQRFGIAKDEIQVSTDDISSYDVRSGSQLSDTWSAEERVWSLSSTAMVTTPGGQVVEGLTAAVSPLNGQLLHSCLGTGCSSN